MELLTHESATGTKLRIDGDRQFEGAPGDSTLRIAGEKDGTSVFDATYIECSGPEAELVGYMLRSLREPSPTLTGKVAQEIHAMFPDRMTGRDAHQAAELCWQAMREEARAKLGAEPGETNHALGHMAERFERAASRARVPVTMQETGGANGGHAPPGKPR